MMLLEDAVETMSVHGRYLVWNEVMKSTSDPFSEIHNISKRISFLEMMMMSTLKPCSLLPS